MRKSFTQVLAVGLMLMLLAMMVGCQSTAVRSAKIYMQQDDPENAKEVLLEGAEVTPEDAELWFLLGRVHADLEEWGEMNEAFAKAQDLTSDFDAQIEETRHEAWRMKYNSGTAPYNEKNFAEAIPRFKVALEIKPNDPMTHQLLASSYMQTDKLDLAETHFKKAIENADDEALTARSFLLMLYWQQEEYEKVIEVADNMLDIGTEKMKAEDPARLSDTIQKKAIALNQLERNDEAIEAWNQAIEADPTNPDFYFNKAILLHVQEDYEGASAAYLKAIELNPSDNEARLSAARALLGGEKYETIVDVLEPWLFPDGQVSTEVVVTDKMDPYQLLRAAYLNLGMDTKSDTLAQILVQLTEKAGS